jgi:hypothetical protein
MCWSTGCARRDWLSLNGAIFHGHNPPAEDQRLRLLEVLLERANVAMSPGIGLANMAKGSSHRWSRTASACARRRATSAFLSGRNDIPELRRGGPNLLRIVKNLLGTVSPSI